MRKIAMITSLLVLIAAYAYISGPSKPNDDGTSIELPTPTPDPNFIPEPETIPEKDYSKWMIPSQIISIGLTNSPNEANSDCIAMYNGQTGGGDLLSTLIADQAAREKVKLTTYTSDYLKRLEYKIVKRMNQQYQSDFYAFKACNIAPQLDVVAGYIWPQDKPSIQATGKFAGEVEFGFEKDGILAIVDNNKVLIYDNLDLINATATGAETLPCDAKVESNGEKIRWSCFKGFKVENESIVGNLVKEYLINLDGSTPKIWEGVKNLDGTIEEKPSPETKNEENTASANPAPTPDPSLSTADAIAQRADQIKFQSCGNLSLYSNQPWYKDLQASTQRTKVNLDLIIQGCHSDNGKILVMIAPGAYPKFGEIYRFDIITQKLERAHIDGKTHTDSLASPQKFGKREGNTIHLEAQGAETGCTGKMLYNYDFLNNVVELKEVQSKCPQDQETKTEKF